MRKSQTIDDLPSWASFAVLDYHRLRATLTIMCDVLEHQGGDTVPIAAIRDAMEPRPFELPELTHDPEIDGPVLPEIDPRAYGPDSTPLPYDRA